MAARGVAGKDVFVSYGREESVKEFVRKLKKDLETEKLSVWLDVEDIPTGREWPKEIGIALRECKALIAVVTRKYVSSEYSKSELYVARGNKKPIFPLIREDGWDESDDSQGVNFMIAASNWAMFRPVDDYGLSLQSLVAGLKGIEGWTEQDPLDSLTGQPRSPITEPLNQTWAEPTPPTASLDEPRPKPAEPAKSCPTAARQCDTEAQAKKKKCNIDPNCRRFVRLILKLSSILSRDHESDATVLGRMKLSLAILKGQDESVGIDPEVYRGATTVQEFFEVMAKYWNCYADHDLLVMVIEATENEEAMEALQCFLRSKDPGMVIPLARCPDAPFRPACSGSETGRRLGTSAEIPKEEKGMGDSPQQIAGRNAIVLEANQRKVCSISQKKSCDPPSALEETSPLLQMEGKSALILEANQKKVCSVSQKKACDLPKPSQDDLHVPPEQTATLEKTDLSQPADTDRTNSTTAANTSQQNDDGDQFLESLLAEEATTRQRSSSTNLVISQQPQTMAPELEWNDDFHHHPDRSHELPPGRVPLVVEVGLDHMTCGMYDCLKDVVASVIKTPREALSLLGAFKGSCILVWHVSEQIAAGIKRIQLTPDDQEMLLQSAVMKMSCGEECLFSITEEELEEMVESGIIPEFAETVSEEGEDMGRVRAITSDEEFERELKQAGETLVVVDFTADWCYWSLVMNPKFAELSEQYTEAEFLQVDTEECEDTAAKYDVDAVPMFAFFRMGKLLHKFSGADPDELEAKIKHFLEGSGAYFPGKGHSLLPKEAPDTKDSAPTADKEGMRDRGEEEMEVIRRRGEEEMEVMRQRREEEEKGIREAEREGVRKEKHESGEEREREESGGSREGKKEEGEDAKVKEKGGESKTEEQPPPVTIDPSLPTTSVQIRLADGSRLIGKFNHSHTVADIHRLISHSQPSLAATSYVLMTTFPTRELTDDTQTLADANLLNAVIRQKLT